jgi:2-keto-4-pentenoate hydratase/2-oxohepta-3-ene-1,7-dioic acid hydratase in catechol pathway
VRIARFSSNGQVGYGVVEGEVGNQTVAVIKGHPFAPIEFTGQRAPLTSVKLLAPVLPSKVLAFAKTYVDHAAEMGGQVPAEPIMFLKPSTSVIGSGDAIRLPALSEVVHHEGELAVVIGRLCSEVPVERAADVILGYTCANDVTARDLQKRDGQWARAKGFDTFCPIGPWIQTELDPADLAITCTVNGEVRQNARTSELQFSLAELVAWASSAMTLLPGDVILTGTPAGVGPLVAGATVEVAIDGIGTLTNQVIPA